MVVFHLDATWLPGGFLGVDLFFVISGYLITRLLLQEVENSGRIRLGAFYRRRARRLLPAAVLLIGVVVLAGLTIWTDERPTLFGSGLSSLLYVNNWWSVFSHQSYFVSTGRAPMLQHLWSLSIEEQYYVVWPAIVIGLVSSRAARKARPATRMRAVAGVAVLLAIGSTVAMAVIAIRTGVPYTASSSRVYFGTDTHSMGLFAGSAAGAWTVLRDRGGQLARPGTSGWDLIGLALLGVLVWRFFSINEYDPVLYRGAFLVFDVIAVAVVCLAARPVGRFGGLLDWAPLRWLARRSYAIYLWHWPVVVVTRPELDVHGSTLLVTVTRVALILALAEASYRLVEQPLRTRTANRATPAIRITAPSRLRMLAPLGAVLALAGLGVGSLLYAGAASGRTGTAWTGPPGIASEPMRPAMPASPATTSSPGTTASPSASAARRPTTARKATARPTVARPVQAPPTSAEYLVGKPAVSAFGDSVLLGAQRALAARDPNIRVDAVESRQAYTILGDVTVSSKSGRLATNVLLHLGNNGIINPTQLASTLGLLSNRRRVVLVTLKVPRDWESPNNSTIVSSARRYSNVRVLDWKSISRGHPDWFYADGLHLTPAGADAYSQLVLSALTA